MTHPVNILHLSDLHFGMDDNPTPCAQRKIILDALIAKIKTLEDEWQPHMVAVTGDVGWKARKSDYDQARKWFEKDLMPAFDLKSEHLVICPGNHDLDRTYADMVPPPDTHKEADGRLCCEKISFLNQFFQNYLKFLDDLQCPPLFLGKANHHLSGVRTISGNTDIPDIRFVVLNSAWFSRCQKEKGNLWIGLPLIQVMKAGKRIDESGSGQRRSPHHCPGPPFSGMAP